MPSQLASLREDNSSSASGGRSRWAPRARDGPPRSTFAETVPRVFLQIKTWYRVTTLMKIPFSWRCE